MSTCIPFYFFTDKYLVYLFHSRNVSFYNSICRYLMFLHVDFFHVYVLISRIGTLCTYFHGQNISFCYTTGGMLMLILSTLCPSTFFHRLEICLFFRSKNISFSNSICRNLMFFNSIFHVCLLFSRLGTFSYFFH